MIEMKTRQLLFYIRSFACVLLFLYGCSNLNKKSEQNSDLQIDRNTAPLSSRYSQGSINEPLKRSPQEEDNAVLPSEKEIIETNARLPVLVSENMMFTKVEYDRDTKTERFYYRFTVDIDKQAINNSAIEQGKEGMKGALLRNSGSMARINAGMTYLYIYCSKDNQKLYEIRINNSDF